MRFDAWCETDVGLKRDINQDTVLIDKDSGLFIVADGMGGHRGGEVASQLASQTLYEIVTKNRRASSPKDLLVGGYRQASRRIYDRSQENGKELNGMGTTMVSMLLKNSTLYIANVGDSRAYLFRKPHFWQLTEDHSLVNEQLRTGLLAEDQVSGFSGKNVITRSVGFESNVACDIYQRNYQPGELYLLCSDGLSGLVTNEKIAEILGETPADQVASRCIKEAKLNGGDDNISVLVVYFRPEDQN